MIKRTVEISTPGCYVHMKHEQLVIEKDGFKVGSVPIEDLLWKSDPKDRTTAASTQFFLSIFGGIFIPSSQLRPT